MPVADLITSSEMWGLLLMPADAKGHKLRVTVSPADGVGTQHFTHFSADYNAGAAATIYAAGERPSYLLLPVIPENN